MLCCVWSGRRDEIEQVKIKENNGGIGEDLTKKNSECKVSIDIWEENGYKGEWSIPCGMSKGMKSLYIYSYK